MNVGLITVGYLISYIQPWNDAVGVGWRGFGVGFGGHHGETISIYSGLWLMMLCQYQNDLTCLSL